MLVRASGWLLYYAGKVVQFQSYRYCQERKCFVRHRLVYYKIFVSLVKIALLSFDISAAGIVLLSIKGLKLMDGFSIYLFLGYFILGLSRLYTLVALVCLSQLDYYQTRIRNILNKILEISSEMENCYLDEKPRRETTFMLLVLLILVFIRLALDIYHKFVSTMFSTFTLYYNTLFSLCYIALGVYQVQLIEWRRKISFFLTEYIENDGYRSRVETERLISCLGLSFRILELQRSYHKLWNTFSHIFPLLVLNFLNLWNTSLVFHAVSTFILCFLGGKRERLEKEFLDQLYLSSLIATREEVLEATECTILAFAAVFNHKFESSGNQVHRKLNRKFFFYLSYQFAVYYSIYFFVLLINHSLKRQVSIRYAKDD